MTKKSILVNKEAWSFLNAESCKQRGFSEWDIERKEKVFNRVCKLYGITDGMVQVTDNSFGGGDGRQNGEWWSWSLEKIKEMLDDAGYEYAHGPDVEFCNA